jgi:hypothetical protein
MAITLNHIIVGSKDQKEAARFLADLFGLPAVAHKLSMTRRARLRRSREEVA